ncbi:hypothetical protein [Sphingomonas bacterium]|uniref:hypothetical protein n=1 Tax=Sphingomonas bacterium TaxID=1895847 RepID=UPI0015773B27|nr:hypothetical protein [Sphingomonas bacterium]
MVDAVAPAGDRLAELLAINEEVEAGALEMKRLAALPALPDGAALSAARLRFSRALRRHLQHIDGAVLPHLRATADAAAKPAIEAFRQLLHDYHEAAAHHVARWPSTSVTADWDGYRRSVDDMLVRLRKRGEVERRDIHPLLAGTGARPR